MNRPISLWLACLLGGLASGQEADIQAPVVVGGGAFQLERPEIYHRDWIDLNKNGQKDAFEDPKNPVELRISDLLGRMSREEKLGQLWQRMMTEKSEQQDSSLLAQGEVGSYLGAAPDAARRNRLQRLAVEESRLGIPLIFGFDTIHGFRTIFPIPLGLSCTWDPELIERVCAASAAESAAAGIDWVFAPMLDIARDPRWGRISEGAGEDPWLASRIAEAAVRGFQGSDPSDVDRVIACLKHFVGYGAVEGGREYNTTEIGLSTLYNIYLPPFRAGVEAGAGSVMSGFNSLNGVPVSGNRFTLTGILRDSWGFTGLVVSDWTSVQELIHHGFAADKSQAAAIALHAGVDLEMVSDCFRTSLPGLVDAGAVEASELDEAVRRVLRLKVRKGLLDRPYTAATNLDSPTFTALAREAAARSCVLLKNDHDALPLRLDGTVALIGPLGDNRPELLGNWSGLGRKEEVVTLREALSTALPLVILRSAAGCGLTDDDSSGFDAAVAAARKSDLVIMAVGEPARFSGENGSRLDLGLPGLQQQLFDRIVATGKPIVTVLFAGRPLAVPTVLEKSAAVLMAWQPGVQAGPGLVDVLTGVVSPSGRLTTTFPRSVGQVPIHYNHLPTGRPFDEYRDGTIKPLLPFGHGLTYTRFEYGPTRLVANQTRAGSLSVTAAVTNTGPRPGTEVAQLYLHDVACSIGPRPVRELKGFQRLTLQPGETQQVEVTLAAADLGCWSATGDWVVEPGSFEVVVAPDAISGEMVGFVLEPNETLIPTEGEHSANGVTSPAIN